MSRAFGRMLAELRADPDSGLLSFEAYAGRTTLMIQYWRSLEDLHRYAHARERAHVPATGELRSAKGRLAAGRRRRAEAAAAA